MDTAKFTITNKDILLNFKTAPPVWDIDFEQRMNGKETYPIMGKTIDPFLIETIIPNFQGLLLTGNCFEKAKIVKHCLKQMYNISIAIGSICITWRGTQYGFHYNPPLEFHTWNVIETVDGPKIIDLSLPGVIIRRQKMKDEYGQFLKEMPLFLINGRCPLFIHYEEFKP